MKVVCILCGAAMREDATHCARCGLEQPPDFVLFVGTELERVATPEDLRELMRGACPICRSGSRARH